MYVLFCLSVSLVFWLSLPLFLIFKKKAFIATTSLSVENCDQSVFMAVLFC